MQLKGMTQGRYSDLTPTDGSVTWNYSQGVGED